MNGIMTTVINKNKEAHKLQQNLEFTKDINQIENQVINLYPEVQLEKFEGFGGAITDAAGYVYSLMNEEQKKTVIDAYFAKERMGYRIIRIHMDSCDFSTDMYEADSDEADDVLEKFCMERTEKYILPMLQDAQARSEEPIELMLSPWSPPSYMKTNGKRVQGGKIKPEYRERWARYICRYIKEFKEQGFIVRRISLQNEPNAAQSWDSCLYTPAEEKEFLKDYMYPALQAEGLADVEIFIWDHNKERIYDRSCEIIDEQTDAMVAGAAFHWYSGDHFEALDLFRRKYPDKKLILSESCLEYNKFDADDDVRNAGRLAHEIIGDLNHGMAAFYDWNILLDEKGGPNHVGNYCHAPFLYHTEEKQLMQQYTQAYLEMFANTICPGAVRIGSSRYTEEIEAAAYQRPDGQIGVVLFNKSAEAQTVVLRQQGMVCETEMPAESLSAVLIRCAE